MWILHLLPDSWIINAIFIIMSVGVLTIIGSYVLKLFPVIGKYAIIIQIVGILLLTISAYLIGGYGVDFEWKQKAAELEKKISEAKVESVKVTTETVVKIIKQKEIVKEKGDEVIKYIDKEIVKYNDRCDIPIEVIKAHDAAARSKSVDTTVTPTTQIPTDEINKAARGNK
jgi:hypothetical protein